MSDNLFPSVVSWFSKCSSQRLDRPRSQAIQLLADACFEVKLVDHKPKPRATLLTGRISWDDSPLTLLKRLVVLLVTSSTYRLPAGPLQTAKWRSACMPVCSVKVSTSSSVTNRAQWCWNGQLRCWNKNQAEERFTDEHVHDRTSARPQMVVIKSKWAI